MIKFKEKYIYFFINLLNIYKYILKLKKVG